MAQARSAARWHAKKLNHTNFDLSPEEFFVPHSVSDKSNESQIEAIHSQLMVDGLYSQTRWMLESVPLPGSHNATERPLPEDLWAALFDHISATAGEQFHEWTGPWRDTRWRSHVVEGQRKPNIVLIPRHYQRAKSTPFCAILTRIELKESCNNRDLRAAAVQLQQSAGFVAACQVNRSFFLGALLRGRNLTLVLIARDATFYSQPINIDEDPISFIKAVIVLSSGLHPALGFDTRFMPLDGMHRLNLGGTPLDVMRRAWVRSTTMSGRGTKVSICRHFRDRKRVFALKDCWVPCNGPNDVVNDIFFSSRKPKEMTTDQQKIFGAEDIYDIFRGCRTTRGNNWDYTKHLHGIPIIIYAEIATFDHKVRGKYVEDTTEAISSRFSSEPQFSMEHRVHIRTLSETCGVPLAWFSCRRQLLSGMMCVVAAHFNGELKYLLHCDISDPNLWICVDDPEDCNDVVPDWPEDLSLYPKHAVVLGDWGMAEDRFPDNEATSCVGGMTGTFPFHAAELMTTEGIAGCIAHDTCHDLEAMFWVLWIMSVNTSGPYNQRREWRDEWRDDGTGPFRGHTREPADAVGKNKNVPVWATPGIHTADVSEVYQFKRSIPEHQFFDSMSSYWSDGVCGQAFKDGMRRLRDHFVWVLQPDGSYAPPRTITHEIFIEILASMRDQIPPDEDRATPAEVEHARQQYAELLQDPDGELGMAVLDAPATYFGNGDTGTSRESGSKGSSRVEI